MRAGDLTTISNVKTWLGLSETSNDPTRDALIMRLIAGASAFIYQQTGIETFAYRQVSRTYDGNGKDFMVLRDYPVVSVLSIGMAGQSTPITATGAFFPQRVNGYLLDPPTQTPASQRLQLVGYCFPNMRGGVAVSYMAGYVEAETYAIPTDPRGITVAQLWTSGVDVTTAAGAVMTQVATTPASGQYAVASGTYIFNAADAGLQVTIRYGFIPADIEQVACELVGLRMKAMTRIGISSQSLAGKETVSYFGSKDLNGVMATVLSGYVNRTPY